jgi:nitroimidazol reductase NimA-like FMN-containing flavoprotein (pyridoxamine 5'-phosphate oxidase superfamily)
MGEPFARRPQVPHYYKFSQDPEGLLPWSYAVERLVAARNYWIATCRPSGAPHTTPLWGVWVDDVLYLDGSPETRWGRNLAANPQVSVNLESADDVVIVEGDAEFCVTDDKLAQQIIDAWTAKYGRLVPEPADEDGGVVTVRPRRVRAWHDALLDGTVWILGDSA